MIIVHHLNNSRSQRILWMLEEMGVAYEIAHHQRDPVTRLAPPELLAVHPLGKSPVIVDDGQVVAESGAILEYLIERHGGGAFAPTSATRLSHGVGLGRPQHPRRHRRTARSPHDDGGGGGSNDDNASHTGVGRPRSLDRVLPPHDARARPLAPRHPSRVEFGAGTCAVYY